MQQYWSDVLYNGHSNIQQKSILILDIFVINDNKRISRKINEMNQELDFPRAFNFERKLGGEM
jgi:hypothetical protein